MAEDNSWLELAKVVGDVVKNAPVAVVEKVLPVDKLIDTLARGAGIFFHPRHIKATAAANAEALIAKTNAAELATDIRQRAKFRRELETIRHQANLESIGAKAEKYLPKEVSGIPVDSGWTADFAEKAQHASRDDLQELWAKVLAGEVSTPGSISRRTLSIVEGMSAKDAARFLKIACACVDNGMIPGVKYRSLVEVGLVTTDMVELAARGLIQEPIESVWQAPNGTQVRYFDEIWVLHTDTGGNVDVDCAQLTDCGAELLRVTDRQPHPGFVAIVEARIKEHSPGNLITISKAVR